MGEVNNLENSSIRKVSAKKILSSLKVGDTAQYIKIMLSGM